MRIAITPLVGAFLFALPIASLSAQGQRAAVPAVPPLPAKSTEAALLAATPTAAAPAAAPSQSQPSGTRASKTLEEADNNPVANVTEIDASSDSNPNDTDGIAATVNDEPISDYELRQRVALYLATSGITQQLAPEQRKRIRDQILKTLEDEKVQLQEAVKKKITVSPIEVDKRINAMMAENHFTITQLRATLAQAGANEEALRAQITASIAWQKAVQDEYGDQVDIAPQMVDEELARYRETANRVHYHVSEIFLPVDNPEQDAKVKKDAEDVETQLHEGAPFPLVARQFSQHPSAATGGDMGWIYAGQLAPELDRALAKMQAGGISDPIRSVGGWYILALRERQEPAGTKIAKAPAPTDPEGSLPLARLLFPVDSRGPKAEFDKVMAVAGQIYAHYEGCAQLADLQKKMPGTIFMNLGETKLSDLSPVIQKGLASTRSGEAASPFVSDAGIELIGRCDKRVPILTDYVIPSREQVENQLFDTQISALARRYLRDLRRDANIQVRDESKPDALIR